MVDIKVCRINCYDKVTGVLLLLIFIGILQFEILLPAIGFKLLQSLVILEPSHKYTSTPSQYKN